MAAWIQARGVGGYFLVAGMVALACIPPFFGFASSLTFAGFTYGLKVRNATSIESTGLAY